MSNIVVSIDDGATQDHRIATMLEGRDIPAVFYIPLNWHWLNISKGVTPMSHKQAEYIAEHFEIGSHTITHRHLTDLPFEDAKVEIEDSKYLLEDLFGVKVTKFAPPRGYTNGHLNRIINKNYESNRLTRGTHLGRKLIHIHPNSGANNNKPWLEVVEKTSGPIELWGHGWEIGKYHLFKELEEYLDSLS